MIAHPGSGGGPLSDDSAGFKILAVRELRRTTYSEVSPTLNLLRASWKLRVRGAGSRRRPCTASRRAGQGQSDSPVRDWAVRHVFAPGCRGYCRFLAWPGISAADTSI